MVSRDNGSQGRCAAAKWISLFIQKGRDGIICAVHGPLYRRECSISRDNIGKGAAKYPAGDRTCMLTAV